MAFEFDAMLDKGIRTVVSKFDPAIDWDQSNREKYEATYDIEHLVFHPDAEPTYWHTQSLAKGEMDRCMGGETTITRHEQMANVFCIGVVSWENLEPGPRRQLRGGIHQLEPESFRRVYNLSQLVEVDDGDGGTRKIRVRIPIVEELANLILEQSLLAEELAKKSLRRTSKKRSTKKAAAANAAK